MNRTLSTLTITAAFLFGLASITSAQPEQSLTQTLKKEPIDQLAKDVREKGNAVRGAILFSQQKLGCVNCHASGNNALLGPDLTRLTDKLTDQQYVEAILNPSKRIQKGFETVTIITTRGTSLTGRILEKTEEKFVLRDSSEKRRRIELASAEIDQLVTNKVSSMPEKLADQLKSRQEFLDLVNYVMSISGTGKVARNSSLGGETISEELRGLVLIKDFNCAACHQDDLPQLSLTNKQAPDLTWSAGRLNPDYMQQLIADPIHAEPGTTMPAMMSSLSKDERANQAKSITNFLVSLSDQQYTHQNRDPKKAEQGRELFHKVGCVACHSPRDTQGKETLAKSSVPLGRIGAKYNIDGLTEFLKSPHKVRPSGRMPNMKLSHWEATDIAHYLVSLQPLAKKPAEFKVNATLVTQGRQAFRALNCNNCHWLLKNETPLILKPLSQVRLGFGCLSTTEGHWPKFGFSAEQRKQIQDALANKAKQLSADDQISVTLTGMRCLNCHQRGSLGGVSDERNPHFQTTNPNLGPQGRIPPTLTNVGAKLNHKWMRQVLVSGKSIRPYVLTRMPQYGAENVESLINLIQKTDELPEVKFAEFKDQKEMRLTGANMVGTGGLNCIACHTFQLKQAATMPAVDLTEMAERLQKRWFYHYMKAPQQLSRNTVMPSYWPGGRAIRQDILAGDPNMQIEALWQYLLDGRQARTPRGLIIEPIELLASDEAVMLRRSYPNVGKRGIGVGYPLQVNLVYDAEQMRLASLWTGKFADPGGVWRSQGHGQVRPLSRDVMQMATGADFDVVGTPEQTEYGRPALHRFRGYRLDEKRRPVLMYEFNGIDVEDYFVDKTDAATKLPFLSRSFKTTSKVAKTGLRLRVASGKNIQKASDGQFLIDGRLLVKVTGGTKVETLDNSVQQLYLIMTVPVGTSSTTIEYHWPGSNM